MIIYKSITQVTHTTAEYQLKNTIIRLEHSIEGNRKNYNFKEACRLFILVLALHSYCRDKSKMQTSFKSLVWKSARTRAPLKWVSSILQKGIANFSADRES